MVPAQEALAAWEPAWEVPALVQAGVQAWAQVLAPAWVQVLVQAWVVPAQALLPRVAAVAVREVSPSARERERVALEPPDAAEPEPGQPVPKVPAFREPAAPG